MRLFGLLADRTRLQIVLLLVHGERNVTDLCAALGLSQPTVSHHLGLLRMGSVVQNRRQGKSIYYSMKGHVSADGSGGFTIDARDCRVRVGPVPTSASI